MTPKIKKGPAEKPVETIDLKLTIHLGDPATARLFSCLAEFYGIPADRLAIHAIHGWLMNVKSQLPVIWLDGKGTQAPADDLRNRRVRD